MEIDGLLTGWLKPESVGLLGELSLSLNETLGSDLTSVQDLVDVQDGRLRSRTRSYYESATVHGCIAQANRLATRLNLLQNTAATSLARYCLADWLTNRLLRALDALVVAQRLSDAQLLLAPIRLATRCLLAAVSLEPISNCKALLLSPPSYQDMPVRTIIEMENLSLLATRALSLASVVDSSDFLVSPLLGAGRVAPFLGEVFGLEWTLVSTSVYSNAPKTGAVDVIVIGELPTGRAIVVDDNVGTGITLKGCANAIAQSREVKGITAVELNWQRWWRKYGTNANIAVFDERELLDPTFICYRHFSLTEALIDSYRRGGASTQVSTLDWLDASRSTATTVWDQRELEVDDHAR